MSQRESNAQTFIVATVLCVVCSLFVSGAAVALKKRQEANALLDQQKNIIDAAGLAKGQYGVTAGGLSTDQIKGLFKQVTPYIVDLDTGEFVTDVNGLDVDQYDPREAVNKSDLREDIVNPEFNPGEKYREKYAKVYVISDAKTKEFQQIVLPVYGKGLWSTLYGYLALKKDLNTIQGLTFYKHAETPGLGGEVDNPSWKLQWEGKELYNPEGVPTAGLAKGAAPLGNKYEVDGLTGATITSRGVTNLIRYWASDDGYKPFLTHIKEHGIDAPNAGS
jgi:Na+-transporting NADH:ubiquinone oxidoreductase subunit C